MWTVELEQQVWETLLFVKALLVMLYDMREKNSISIGHILIQKTTRKEL